MLVRGMHVQEPPFTQRSKNRAQERSENITNSKCMLTPTNLLRSHRDMLANPGIDERGGYSMYISRGSGGMLKRFFCRERASGAI